MAIKEIQISGESEQVYVLGTFSGGRTNTADFTLYVNPYMVVGKGGKYTKHIYIGSERIVSKLGDLGSFGADPRRVAYAGANTDVAVPDYKAMYNAEQAQIKARYDTLDVPYNGTNNDDYVNGAGFCCNADGSTGSAGAAIPPSGGGGAAGGGGGNITGGNDNPEKYQYYYHSDHLGSTSYITNLDGEVSQHVEYMPFGEVFLEERDTTWNSPYKFNGKELDEETGLYYYGARYYDPRTSLWLSTDPMAEKYPGVSPYAYCADNPLKYNDPSGDTLVLSGRTDNLQATTNTYNTGLGGYYTTSVDANGKVSMSAVKGTDPNNMTTEQQAYYMNMNTIVNGAGTTTINVEKNTSVIIGDIYAHAIDIGDIQALGNGSYVNQSSALLHETLEEYDVQVKGMNTNDAHNAATQAEVNVTGLYLNEYTMDPNRPIVPNTTGGALQVPILDNSTQKTIKTVQIYLNFANNVIGVVR